MLTGIATEHGLGCQHLDQATQATHEGDLAGLTACVRLRASPLGEQLDFSPLEGDAHLVEESSRDPRQCH